MARMETALRIISIALLSAILIVLVSIRDNLPPTFGDFKAADSKAQRALILRRPMVRADVANWPSQLDPMPVRIEP